MSYCPECGSEVANNDTFCAYCGISLQVIPETSVSESSQPENLPKLGEPEKIQTSASLNKEPINPTELYAEKPQETLTQTPPTPFILEETPGGQNEEIFEKPKETSSTMAEDEQTNSQAVLEGDLVEEKIGEEVVGKEINAEPIVENIQNSIAEIELETNSQEPNISSPVSEILENTQEEKTETTSHGQMVDEFSQTIPYTPADFVNHELASPFKVVTEPQSANFEEEDRLKSVLDEIDSNLQAENNLAALPQNEVEKPELEPLNLSEVTAETENKAEVNNPNTTGEVMVSESQNFETPTVPETFEENSAETPVLTENAVSTPILESQTEIDESSVVIMDSSDISDKRAQSFTNPNIGVGDTDGRNKQKLKPLDEGTVLNQRYEVIRKLGGGGMGAVYLANDKNLGGVLRAVKEMVQSYIEEAAQEKAVNDFKRESLLLTSLEHPGIPTIYDYFFDEKEGRFYLVMKYISGGDLSARLRAAPEGRIDEVSVTDWAIQIADVLDYLHNRQPPIVYRDLKPSNIMIDGNTGKVMIIDFGIARWVNKEEKGVTAVGTMGYAPPELFSGNVEPRSDIYSLGSTMFHLLTGADPQSNPLLIFDFNKNPRPRQINPNLSDQMEQILMRSVEYNSEQRFTSAAEMRDELSKHLENLKKGAITFGVISNVVSGQSLSSVPVFCGFCGQKIVATDMFCPFCGAQQPLVGQSQKLKPTPTYIAPNVTAKLLVVGTNDLEQTEYSLEKDNNLLGRRDPMSNIFPEVDMSKYDPQTKISRKHARIWREGDLFMLEDLGSSNGTILISGTNNDAVRLLPRQPHVLSHGDKLKLGDTTLRFTIG